MHRVSEACLDLNQRARCGVEKDVLAENIGGTADGAVVLRPVCGMIDAEVGIEAHDSARGPGLVDCAQHKMPVRAVLKHVVHCIDVHVLPPCNVHGLAVEKGVFGGLRAA